MILRYLKRNFFVCVIVFLKTHCDTIPTELGAFIRKVLKFPRISTESQAVICPSWHAQHQLSMSRCTSQSFEVRNDAEKFSMLVTLKPTILVSTENRSIREHLTPAMAIWLRALALWSTFLGASASCEEQDVRRSTRSTLNCEHPDFTFLKVFRLFRLISRMANKTRAC